ncbi:MAG: hypothetical protein M1819_006668 [Sarea resinae]|nr:MAG: hypothetical protein M1819_006668 [Sarea resinae]
MSAYGPEQLKAYLELISLPGKYLPAQAQQNGLQAQQSQEAPFPLPAEYLNLELLTALHVGHISSIPYENLSLHYSASHRVELDPLFLYEKIVTGSGGDAGHRRGSAGDVGSEGPGGTNGAKSQGRGGYCMENALFFWNMLMAIGFEARLAGVRIRERIVGVPKGGYVGWVHVVNIVTLPNGAEYMLDVSFGGDGPTLPLPLTANLVHYNSVGTQEIRLIHSEDPFTNPEAPPSSSTPAGEDQAEDKKHRFWIYQYRNDPLTTAPDGGWNSFYAFSDAYAFRAADLKVMNWYTSTHPESFQTFTALVVKFLRRRRALSGKTDDVEDEGEFEIYGKRMLVDNVIKENTGGKTRVVQVCQTEKERVEALEKWFGIYLTEEQRRGIAGTRTEIVG